MTKIVDLLFVLCLEACLNPAWFALTLLVLGLVILGVGYISTRLLERFE